MFNPIHKTERGRANRWETTNSKPQGPIINDGPIRNTEQQSDPIYYTLLFKCTQHCCAFNQPLCAQCAYLCWAKTNFLNPNRRHMLDFPSSNYTVHDHTLNTAWDAQWNFVFSLKHFVLLGTYMGGIRHGCYFNVDKEAILIVIHTNSHFPKWLYLTFCLKPFSLGTFIKPFGNIIGTLRAYRYLLSISCIQGLSKVYQILEKWWMIRV